MKPKLVFVHGWGFHGGVWSKIVPHFADYEISYWGSPYIRGGPELSRDIADDAIVVAYSFGVAQVIASAPPNMAGLVSICGFDSLVKRGREEAVRDLLNGLERNPYAQMRAFWANCGVSGFAPREALDTGKLAQGLLDMLGLDAGTEVSKLACPVMALASLDDRIVPRGVSEAVWEEAGLIVSQSGGHGLPLTRAQWCASEIERFLKEHVA